MQRRRSSFGGDQQNVTIDRGWTLAQMIFGASSRRCVAVKRPPMSELGHERQRGSKPPMHACPLRAKSGGSVIAIRSVATCRQQSLGYSISLALRGPQARRSALDLDLACNP